MRCPLLNTVLTETALSGGGLTTGSRKKREETDSESSEADVGDAMSEKAKHHGEGHSDTGTKKKRRVLSLILILVLAPLGYVTYFRPVIVMAPSRPGIYVKNDGRSDGLIHRVDAFWYWSGKVALVSDLPGISQQLAPGEAPVRLQIPDLPGPVEKADPRGPWYMKLVVRYRIPGIPVFRYNALLYYRFDRKHGEWTPIESIPPKYRALGKMGMGDVGSIELGLE